MDAESLVPMLIGVIVIVIVGGLGLVTSHKSGTMAEDRLAGPRSQGAPLAPRNKISRAESWRGRRPSTSGDLRS